MVRTGGKKSDKSAKTGPNPRAFSVKTKRHVDVFKEALNASDTPVQGENEFSMLHQQLDQDGVQIIDPPIEPRLLELLVQKSSVLPPLIDAMEVNIDGTGAEILAKVPASKLVDKEAFESEEEVPAPTVQDPDTGESVPDPAATPTTRIVVDHEAMDREIEAIRKGQEEDIAELEGFFDQPWEGSSFRTMRRRMRRDQETTGNAYLEVVRNRSGQVAGVRRREAQKMRLVKLDKAVPVRRAFMRNGKEVVHEYLERERRYASVEGQRVVYFKDFGVQRDIDRDTGKWVTSENASKPGLVRGSEIIHFVCKEDVHTPYGIPRWFSNVPNVLGSRKAEEANLEYFDSAGVPPMLFIVQGGYLAENAADSLRDNFLSGNQRNQAAVLEAFGTSGDLDSTSNVRVTVERFEQREDLQFKDYLLVSDNRTQRSFRMPKLFTGDGSGANFATAFVDMMVADAQVFGPERAEFDEIVNLKLMPELPNGLDYEYRSVPLTIPNMEQKLAAMALVADKVELESLVSTVNSIGNMALVAKDEETDQGGFGEVPFIGKSMGEPNSNDPNPVNSPNGGKEGGTQVQLSDNVEVKRLATTAVALLASRASGEAWGQVRKQIDELTPKDFKDFRTHLASELYGEAAVNDFEAASLAWVVTQSAMMSDAL